ncbi:hypothetical protein FRX31_007651 [Thalictrum thalictroides]|uniref:Transmembrane protein n=1 Tax=Thalictrum thalictroides TaxID=46969 RepID=A0A7J6X201_THATH|nr:hypothetical protein FRX31_007651 [Thalictrum thalictroides]
MSTTTTLPEQQYQPQQVLFAAPAATNSSGSVGPFFIVMAVLGVITVLSCVVGRFVARRTVDPLDIRYGDHCWWLRKRLCCCIPDHKLELGGKAIKRNGKPQDIETPCSLPST